MPRIHIRIRPGGESVFGHFINSDSSGKQWKPQGSRQSAWCQRDVQRSYMFNPPSWITEKTGKLTAVAHAVGQFFAQAPPRSVGTLYILYMTRVCSHLSVALRGALSSMYGVQCGRGERQQTVFWWDWEWNCEIESIFFLSILRVKIHDSACAHLKKNDPAELGVSPMYSSSESNVEIRGLINRSKPFYRCQYSVKNYLRRYLCNWFSLFLFFLLRGTEYSQVVQRYIFFSDFRIFSLKIDKKQHSQCHQNTQELYSKEKWSI